MLAAVLIFLGAYIAGSPVAQVHLPVDADLADLDKVLGLYPPNIHSDQEKREAEQKYDAALSAVNVELEKKPQDTGMLLKRARIERMGHNLDRQAAFEAAEKDLKAVIQREPKHVDALVELGSLYVNSGTKLASAETLFKQAQEAHGKKPLEPAQCGLLFAYYYQGRTQEAEDQAELLVKTWPEEKEYQRMRDILKDVRDRLKKGEK
jgi:tetratricopeptide (TPR) repeat protein